MVLKDERRDLYQDAGALFPLAEPQKGRYRSRDCLGWDVSGLTSWPQVTEPVRVVRSQKTDSAPPTDGGEAEAKTNEWIWVTALEPI